MASRRKSTIPCMVRATDMVEHEDQDDDELMGEMKNGSQVICDGWTANPEIVKSNCEVVEEKVTDNQQSQKHQGGYECKYCPFSCPNVNEFTEHVDTQHPNVILNPLYVCAECNFTTKKYDTLADHNSKSHTGESNLKLKLIKRNNQTILEQTIEGLDNVALAGSISVEALEKDGVALSGITFNKMPVMKMGTSKIETKRIQRKGEEASLKNQMEECTTVVASVTNGREVIKDAVLQEGAAHVMPSVQLPPNINLVPKVPVPLNSTKYNSALDTNATLIGSFNKFPYPTQAELSWLTAASKHPEEQIRIWFATQRLKHGISWSPEEVEEARKKMFNGTIQQVPQTITVLPAHLTATTKVSQSIIQTAVPCQILGQHGLVFTQMPKGPAMTCTPVTLAVSGNTSHAVKRPLQSPQNVLETKQLKIVNVTPKEPKPNTPAAALSHERKKTKEQIAALKASFVGSQFPDDREIYRLIQVTGLSRSEIKKWFSDHRYRTQRGIVHITSESIALSSPKSSRSQHLFSDFSPHKFKEKNSEQLKILEESFLLSSFPAEGEIDRLRAETKLTRREIDSWFLERRKLRDNMEQTVLDTSADSSGNEQKTPNGSVVEGGEISSSPLSSPLPSALSSSSSATDKKTQEQLHFLKSTFARTQWPSPEEYDQLAEKTGLVRTEIVRWFKDNRLSLKNGSLKWIEQYQKQNAEGDIDQTENKGPFEAAQASKSGIAILEEYYRDHKELREEDLDKLAARSKLNCEQIRDWFTQQQTNDCMDASESNSREDQGSEGNADADWVEVTIGDGDDDDDAVSDCTDNWSQTAPEGPAELAEYDSESMSAENSLT